MFENSLTASASVESVKSTSISSLIAPCCNNPANTLARSLCSPTIIRDGYKLSYKARPSRKNSGEKIMFSQPNFALTSLV